MEGFEHVLCAHQSCSLDQIRFCIWRNWFAVRMSTAQLVPKCMEAIIRPRPFGFVGDVDPTSVFQFLHQGFALFPGVAVLGGYAHPIHEKMSKSRTPSLIVPNGPFGQFPFATNHKFGGKVLGDLARIESSHDTLSCLECPFGDCRPHEENVRLNGCTPG